ncbi:MAG: DEAD-box ATP-dependent RNA helicase CshA [Turneriella sp.]|nr:DEAD-box ATP-dependent RNA helicase CshA [Turneriella sp.]
MGFREASPIQEKAIPILLEGHDLIGQAQTGTGKTAAFGIPVIERVTADKHLQAMVLCPTRELAVQVADEMRKLLKYKKAISIATVYGGQKIGQQFRDLKLKPQIIVGTPGRVMDHLRRKTIKMNTVKFFVLDEADEMLAQGFREDIELILTDAPPERQTILFSATMSKEIMRITERFLTTPKHVNVLGSHANKPKIEEWYSIVADKNRVEAAIRLMDFYSIKTALVFSNMKSQVDFLTHEFNNRGFSAEGIHGDLNQSQRDKVMARLKSGNVRLLVATDVAGRGIDIGHIEAVFNFDLPRDSESYIHRIGRTGRAGKSGRAFAFVRTNELGKLKRLEKNHNTTINPHDIPTLDMLMDKRAGLILSNVKSIAEKANLENMLLYVQGLVEEGFSVTDVAASALKVLFDKAGGFYDKKAVFAPMQEEIKAAKGKSYKEDGKKKQKYRKFGNRRR